MYKLRPIADDFLFLEFDGRRWPTAANVWVIVDGDGLVLIDTGLNSNESFNGIADCISAAGHRVADIHTILLTHGHTDHIAGVRRFLRGRPRRLLLSARSVPLATDPALHSERILPQAVRNIVPELAAYDVLANFQHTCGDWLLAPEDIMPIHDGDRLRLGRYEFTAIHVPGHEDGLKIFHESDRGLVLSTDLLRNAGAGAALPWYPSTAGGVDAYLASLDKAAGLSASLAFPSHGGVITDFQPAVADTRAVIVGRQQTIETLLSIEYKTCSELDRELFSAKVLELCPWFSSVTEAHLAKIASEGRLQRNGIRFRLVA